MPNYSKSTCMECKEKPPKYRVLRNGGQVESWFCEDCMGAWLDKNWESVVHYDRIGEEGLPKRYKVKRTAKAGVVEKEWQVEILEKQEEKQLAYGLILRPDVTDSQGDIYTAEEVEKACHSYGAKSGGATDWLHKTTLPKTTAVLVESFIAPVDFVWNGYQILKGDWLGAAWVPDQDKWAAIKKGEIKSFSIKGTGRRIPVGS